MAYDDSQPFWTRRTCCCPRWLCFLITTLLLIGIGLTLFFCIPRIPSVSVTNVVARQDSDGLEAAIVCVPDTCPLLATTQIAFSMNLAVNVVVNSSNYIDIGVAYVAVNVMPSENPSLIVGTGVVYDITIAKMATTNFQIPIQAVFTALVTDSLLRSVLIDCGLSGAANSGQLNIMYTADIMLDVAKGLNRNITVSGSISEACPVDLSGSQYSQFAPLLTV